MAALRLSTGADEHGRNKAAAAAVPPTAYCRVCFEGAEPGASPLVSPCQCTGSQAVIHRSCLRRWQRAALGSGNPARARVCGVCKAPYAPCFRIAKGQAARWGRKERLMLLQQQQRAEQQGSEAAAEGRGGEDDDVGLHGDGNASVMAGLRQAAGLLSPGGVLKSVTIFGLALVVPYLVLAYYAAFALSYIDPFDGAGRFGSSAAEAEQRRAAREAAAAAVAPGRTFLVASSSIAPGSIFHRSVVFVLEHAPWGSRGVIVNKLLLRSAHRRPGLRTAGRVLFGHANALSACALLGGPVDPHCLTVIHNDEAAAAAAARGVGGRPWEVAPGLFVETSEGCGRGCGADEAPAQGSSGSSGLLGLLQRWRRDGAGAAPAGAPSASSSASSVPSSMTAAAAVAGARGARAFVGYAGWSAQQLREEIRRGDWHVFDADADAAHLLFELAVEADGGSGSTSSIPTSEGQEEDDGDGEGGGGGVMDAGALLWRELVASIGEGEDDDDDEEPEYGGQ